MKNNKYFSTIAVSSAIICASAVYVSGELRLTELRKSKPVHLSMPAVAPDSAVASVNKFKLSDLLGAKGAIAREFSQDWTTVATDTAGFVNLTKPQKGALLHILKGDMRPERFVKGKLIVRSTSPTEVLMNGKSLAKKETADSIATPLESHVTLEPEVIMDIQVNVLVAADEKSEPKVSIEFLPDEGFEKVTLYAGPKLKERFSIETIHIGRRLSSTQMSPDGKYIISHYSEFISPENQRSWATLTETVSGKIIDGDLDQTLSWFPTGSSLMQIQKISDRYDIYSINPQTRERKLFAKDVPTDQFEMSADGEYIVYYDQRKGEMPSGVMRRVDNPDDRIPGNRNRNYLVKYDFKTGVAQPLNGGGETSILHGISPDSKKILYSTSRFEADKFPFYFNHLIEMDVNTLATDTIIKDIETLQEAVYSPDGKKLLILSGPAAFNEIGLNAGNHEIPNEYDTQAYLFDLKSRSAHAMSKNFDPSINPDAVWNKGDNTIYFTAKEGFYNPLFSMNPSSGDIKKLPIPVDYVRNFSLGNESGKWVSTTGMGYSYAGVGYLCNTTTDKVRVLDDPYGEEMRGLNLGKTESWQFTASDGTLIDGTLTLPPDFDPSRKYPLIVYYYGGTVPSDRSMHHPYTPQLFASRDYVVYVVNPSGTIGYGQEFSARHVNAWGKRTAEDIVEGVKELCKTHKFIDDKKIGCLGASYGGFMTQYLQTITDIFAAAVSHAGISNVTSYWGEGYWGYSYNSVAAAKSYPWTNPELFTRQGSLFNADKIHTPLLLLHGTVDTNVPIGESIQLYNALKILNRDVELITVEGSDHVVTDYEKRKLWHATIMAWFAKYLQDDPSWWNSLYGNN